MIRLFILALFLSAIPAEGWARTIKMGDMANQKNQKVIKTGKTKSKFMGQEISCFENSDCPYDKECVALRCENVCKNSICAEGTYCAPAGKDKPHEFKCTECVINAHCPKGLFCDSDYTCKKPDPCEKAVCSPAAPFCMPKPFQSLPYTCVQCLNDSHCPPVAGLTRRCDDGYCLFNVEGNTSPKKTESPLDEPKPVAAPSSASLQQKELLPADQEEYYDDDYYEDGEYEEELED